MDAARRRTQRPTQRAGRRAEHPGRSRNPLIKVRDLAWLEFEETRPGPRRSLRAGVRLHHRAAHAHELHLRGTDAGSTCVIVRRGTHSRFVGPAFAAQERPTSSGSPARPGTTRTLPEAIGGVAVELTDPSGIPVRVVSRMHELAELPAQQPHTFNFGRSGTHQRHPAPAARTRQGAEVGARRAAEHEVHPDLDWYLDHLGLIVSDFMYYPASATAARR